MVTQVALSQVEKPYLKGIVCKLDCICDRLQVIEHKLKYTSVSHQLLDALADPNNWVVWGRVVDEQCNGVYDVIISLFDRDFRYDERLGCTRTNKDGEFCIFYRTEDFQDLMEDDNPDLYLKVMDQQGNTLFCWETPVRCQAGRFERFDISLGGAATS
ncbi:MAG: hypothetical protein QNJ46_05340 [Leptolyngbyaceae cyanobacterium MO_188.B28]|nr:hypothetical protein [Leptolyngbyaceae cyanobacterium MO_188.B28]